MRDAHAARPLVLRFRLENKDVANLGDTLAFRSRVIFLLIFLSDILLPSL